MFPGISFESRAPGFAGDDLRADVACFVGFVRVVDGPLLARAERRWISEGWSHRVGSDPALSGLPVLLESPADLDGLDGVVRPSQGLAHEGYLIGAVQDFFRQGGRRCWVVPAGPPPDPTADPAPLLAQLLGRQAEVGDSTTWHGLAHLLGLADVSLVCLPDLPALLGAPRPVPAGPPTGPLQEPVFLECSTPPPEPEEARVHLDHGPPRLGPTERAAWRTALAEVLTWLGAHRPDITLLAALPLGPEGSAYEADPLPELGREGLLAQREDGGVGTGLLQLAYPWLRSDTSHARPGGWAPADGALAGLLARNALARGTFSSAEGLSLEGIADREPRLSRRALWTEHEHAIHGSLGRLVQRINVVHEDFRGVHLLSDVTTSRDPSWRQGGVNRLVGVVRREAVRLGEPVVFETNGPPTWRTLRLRLESLLGSLQALGAIHPERSAIEVRCGRDTMTQHDLDTGRLVAELSFRPTRLIEHITVVLTITNGVVEFSGSAA